MGVDERQVEELFYEARERLDPAERAAWLDRACGEHAELRERVERLLAAEHAAADFLRAPRVPRPQSAEGCARSEAAKNDVEEAPSGEAALAGRYRLGERLGEGGMGTVYRAEQFAPLRRTVAIKVLKEGLDSREFTRRFEFERQTLALLDHPHVAKILDAGVTVANDPLPAGRPYFVMELVDGRPITQYCDQRRLPYRARLELFVAVCHAMQHAHQNGVLHRDLKPGNVLVVERDGRPAPKVIDFGVAKSLRDATEGMTQHTSGATLVGTVEYMAPEQAEFGAQRVDTRTDVYSLGVLLYELLAGRVPFVRSPEAGESWWDLLRTIREAPPPPPSVTQAARGAEHDEAASADVTPNPATTTGNLPRRRTTFGWRRRALPVELDAITLKCLEKDPDRRYASPRDLADDILRFLDGRPIVARRSSPARRIVQWCRRNPLAAALAAAVGATFALGFGVATYFAVAESRRAVAESQARREGLERLARAHVSEARALRMSGRPGQRFAALRALVAARDITGPTRELAVEAVAALSLPDWEVTESWDGYPPDTLALALSPTFDRDARVGGDGMLEVRSLPERRSLARFPALGKPADYGGLRFSDDGRLLLETYPTPEPRCRVWRLDSPPTCVSDSPGQWCAVSPDGRWLAIVRDDALERWDVATKTPVRVDVLSLDAGADRMCVWHPTRLEMVVATQDSWRHVDWTTKRVGPVHADDWHGWPTFHPHGAWLALSRDGEPSSTALFEASTGRRTGPELRGPKTGGRVSFFARSGDVLFTNDWQGVLRMWEPRTGRRLLQRPSQNLNNLVVSRADDRIGPEISGSECRILRFASGSECGRIGLGADEAMRAPYDGFTALAPDGRLLAVTCRQGVALVDVRAGLAAAHIPSRDAEELQAIAFLADGSLCTYGERGWQVWRVQYDSTGATATVGPPRRFTSLAANGLRASVSSDGRTIAAEATVIRGEALRGAVITRFRSPNVAPAATSSDSERNDSKLEEDKFHDRSSRERPNDGTPRIDRLEDELLVVGAGTDIRSVSVSPDGRLVATGLHSSTRDVEHNAHVWDADSGRLVQALPTRGLCQVRFSPQGDRLIVHSDDTRTCRVFRVDTWACEFEIASRGRGRFSPSQRLFAVETGLGEISLRRGEDYVEFAKLSCPEETTFFPLFFTPDDARLFAWSSETGQVHFWDLAGLRRELETLELAGDWPPLVGEKRDSSAPPLRLVIRPASETAD